MKNIIRFVLPSQTKKAAEEGYIIFDVTVFPVKGREDAWKKFLAPSRIHFQEWKSGKISTACFCELYKSKLRKSEFKDYLWTQIQMSYKTPIALVSYNKEVLTSLREVMVEVYKDHQPQQLELFA